MEKDAAMLDDMADDSEAGAEDDDLVPRDPLTWGARPFVEPSTYLTDPPGYTSAAATRVEVHARIRAHVGSPEYRQRVQQIEAANRTGIIIPAGGSRYTANMLITLKVCGEGRCNRTGVIIPMGVQQISNMLIALKAGDRGGGMFLR